MTAAFGKSELELLNVPAGARLYVDGKPKTLHDNRLALPVGRHKLQLEVLVDGKVLVARHEVTIETDQVKMLTPELLPVLIPDGIIWVEGLTGQKGLPGPPGTAFTAPDPNTDLKTLAQPFQDALWIIVDELADDARSLQREVRRDVKYRFWRYDPQNVFPTGTYGPMGPPGIPGLPALPGETTLLMTESGRPILAEIEERLKLPQLRARLAVVEKRYRSRQYPGSPIEWWQTSSVSLFTPEWRALCDRKYRLNVAQYRKEEAGMIINDPAGKAGLPGRRGPRGTGYPEGSPTQKVVLPEKRLQELLDHFEKNSKSLQEWMSQVEKFLDATDSLLSNHPK